MEPAYLWSRQHSHTLKRRAGRLCGLHPPPAGVPTGGPHIDPRHPWALQRHVQPRWREPPPLACALQASTQSRPSPHKNDMAHAPGPQRLTRRQFWMPVGHGVTLRMAGHPTVQHSASCSSSEHTLISWPSKACPMACALATAWLCMAGQPGGRPPRRRALLLMACNCPQTCQAPADAKPQGPSAVTVLMNAAPGAEAPQLLSSRHAPHVPALSLAPQAEAVQST
jgi:hypothetical protein